MVNLNPANFVDDGGLLDLSLTELVLTLQEKEKSRFKLAKDDENEAEDHISIRGVPQGMMMVLDGSARRLGITRALLTRCASHQIVSWLDSQERIKEIAGMYSVISDAAEEYGYADMYSSMSSPDYLIATTSTGRVHVRTIHWVKNKLIEIANPLGMSTSALFTVGLCYSLTRGDDITRTLAERYLMTEVERFLQHIEERAIELVGFNDIVRRRARKSGLEENPLKHQPTSKPVDRPRAGA
jgi:hypothetical protein